MNFLSSQLILALLLLPALANAGYPATPDDLKGLATLNCSGTLIRLKRGLDQPAVLLTNGHCAQRKFIDPDTAIANTPYDRSDISLYYGAIEPEKVIPTRVLYATMTDTDIALIELKSTYRELEAKGARIYELSDTDTDAKEETPVQLVSGFHKEKQLCTVSHIVDTLIEDVWTYRNAIALTDPCPIEGGWSGTPLMDPTTLKVVAILNSSNLQGGLCTLENPCEVSRGGDRLAFRGRAYAQRTAGILACVNHDGEMAMNQPGCNLKKPPAAPVPPKPAPSPSPSPAPAPKTSTWPGKRTRTPSSLARPATAEELNGMVKALNCSGTFVSIGRKDSAKGIVLTAGHCPSSPLFYKNGEAASGTDLSQEKNAIAFTADRTLNEPLTIPLTRLTYATMTNADVALLEVKETHKSLAAENIRFLKIADRLPKPGEVLRITSAFWQETEECEVEKILEDRDAETAAVGMATDQYTFRNSILFKSPCYGREGWSGSPVFDPNTGLVYGVLSRVYKRKSPLSFARWNPFNPTIELFEKDEVQVVASNITDLKDCLTTNGKIDMNAPHCQLPKPPKTGINSLWPSSRARR